MGRACPSRTGADLAASPLPRLVTLPDHGACSVSVSVSGVGIMSDESLRVKSATGRCPEHGTVRTQKQAPRPQRPSVVYLWRLVASGRAPCLCPQCGATVARS
jgi:hypothetical protein